MDSGDITFAVMLLVMTVCGIISVVLSPPTPDWNNRPAHARRRAQQLRRR
jgi:hypothetical protein